MGNSQSGMKKEKNKKFDNFYEIVDYIASYYILTSDFQSLEKLSQKEYCDKLVVLTADIIKDQFNDLEITYLAQRIKDGKEINNLQQEKVAFINKDKLDKMDISNDLNKSIKKKRVCIGIAKYYIRIAHLFSAIIMTINPIYTYKDNEGKIVKTDLMNKDKIPKGTPRSIDKLNICDNRLKALRSGEKLSEDKKTITINPKVCDMNIDKLGAIKSLNDEPGIPEFKRLYFDDEYDYSTGQFTGMSSKTEAKFRNDLSIFYKAFTDGKELPTDIKTFSDIKLRDFSKIPECQSSNPIFKKTYTISTDSNFYKEYATNIKQMINKAVYNQNKLLSIINDLFIFVEEPYTKQRKIKINPALSEQLLQENIVKTRSIIMNLYIGCENDYVQGIKIYEGIVSKKILETTQNQLANLNENKEKLLKSSNNNINMKTKEFKIDNNINSNNDTAIDDKVYSSEEINKFSELNDKPNDL
jgi:hypothetical protein